MTIMPMHKIIRQYPNRAETIVEMKFQLIQISQLETCSVLFIIWLGSEHCA